MTIGVAATLVAAVLTAGSPASAAEQVVLSVGHTDAVDVHYDGGQLSLKVNDDTVSPSVVRNPADVTFQVLPESAIEVPEEDSYAFLGAPGSTVWVLPQVQQEGLLWPGWNTTTLPNGVFAGDKVSLSLVDVQGPGELWVFMVDPFGNPLMRFRTDDDVADVLDVPTHTHAHANWAFSALGSYTLTFQADATLIDGTRVTTGPVPYRFVVGDLPTPEPISLAITGLAAGYAPGAPVSLAAVQTPAGSLSTYQWARQCPGETAFADVTGETAAQYQFTATAQLNGCQYQVRLIGVGGQPVATAAPVALTVTTTPAPALSQTITVTIDETQGALVVSVDPDDRTVALPQPQLSPSGDRWETGGALRPVTVTDTRAARPGWNVTGQVRGPFAAGGMTFAATHLGWTPTVTAQAAGQQVAPGPRVLPLLSGGTGGLSTSCVLGSAALGAGRGTAKLGADLRLELPTETAGGAYTATLVLTVI